MVVQSDYGWAISALPTDNLTGVDAGRAYRVTGTRPHPSFPDATSFSFMDDHGYIRHFISWMDRIETSEDLVRLRLQGVVTSVQGDSP